MEYQLFITMWSIQKDGIYTTGKHGECDDVLSRAIIKLARTLDHLSLSCRVKTLELNKHHIQIPGVTGQNASSGPDYCHLMISLVLAEMSDLYLKIDIYLIYRQKIKMLR